MAANAERLRKSAVGTFYVYLVFLSYLFAKKLYFFAIRISPSLTAEVWSIYILTLVFVNSSLNPLIFLLEDATHSTHSTAKCIFNWSQLSKITCEQCTEKAYDSSSVRQCFLIYLIPQLC